jgi:hypothetical protein
VVNAIQPLPDTIKAIGLNLGGLVSPPVPVEGTLEEPTALNGGTLFDNIAVDAEVDLGFKVEVKSPGLPVSWFGSVIGLGQFLGEELVVTPPAPPPVAEAEAAKLAAPVDVAPPALTEAPADEAATPAIDVPAPAEEVVDSVVVDIPEVEAPADVADVADDPEPAASVGSDDDGDSDVDDAAAGQLVAGKPLRSQVDLDSMDWLNFIIGLHQRFRVDIPEADYATLTTLDEIRPGWRIFDLTVMEDGSGVAIVGGVHGAAADASGTAARIGLIRIDPRGVEEPR